MKEPMVKVKCPNCGKRISVTSKGKIRTHDNDNGRYCWASGKRVDSTLK